MVGIQLPLRRDNDTSRSPLLPFFYLPEIILHLCTRFVRSLGVLVLYSEIMVYSWVALAAAFAQLRLH